MSIYKLIILFLLSLCLSSAVTMAQPGQNDTIRLGSVIEHGIVYPMILLPEFTIVAKSLNEIEIRKLAKLRNDVFTVYPYAIAAAAILKDVKTNLEKEPDRKARKHYIKSIDKILDQTFKKPLKNLTIDQGNILVKLIDRQTGESCFSLIREYKNGFAAIMWQSVGIFFNNNLNHRYDPTGIDKDIENTVHELETSNLYRYELYQQQLLLSKVKK